MVRNVDYGAPGIAISQIYLILLGGFASSIVLPRVIRMFGFLHFRDAHILRQIQDVLNSSWLRFEGYMRIDDPLGFARAELHSIQISLIERSLQYERRVWSTEHPLATMYGNVAHELYDFLASERSLVRELPEDVKVRLEEIAVLVAGGPAFQLFEEREFRSSYEVFSLGARVRRALVIDIESADPLGKTITTLVKIATLVLVIYSVVHGQTDLHDFIKTLFK